MGQKTQIDIEYKCIHKNTVPWNETSQCNTCSRKSFSPVLTCLYLCYPRREPRRWVTWPPTYGRQIRHYRLWMRQQLNGRLTTSMNYTSNFYAVPAWNPGENVSYHLSNGLIRENVTVEQYVGSFKTFSNYGNIFGNRHYVMYNNSDACNTSFEAFFATVFV